MNFETMVEHVLCGGIAYTHKKQELIFYSGVSKCIMIERSGKNVPLRIDRVIVNELFHYEEF